MVYEQSPTITYRWREGFPHRGANAQVIGEALGALQRTHGDLTPQAIVEAARKKDSPLYPFIEHNRDKAAAAYRLSQAWGYAMPSSASSCTTQSRNSAPPRCRRLWRIRSGGMAPKCRARMCMCRFKR